MDAKTCLACGQSIGARGPHAAYNWRRHAAACGRKVRELEAACDAAFRAKIAGEPGAEDRLVNAQRALLAYTGRR